MSASPRSVLRPVASELVSVPFAFVASPVVYPVASVECVASEGPRLVLSRALLRARKQRQVEQSQRIARRRSIDVASKDLGFVTSFASAAGPVASRRLH